MRRAFVVTKQHPPIARYGSVSRRQRLGFRMKSRYERLKEATSRWRSINRNTPWVPFTLASRRGNATAKAPCQPEGAKLVPMSVLVSVDEVVRRRAATHGLTWPERSVLGSVVARAAKVSLVVGTCLTLINQGDALLDSAPTPALWWKVPLTYCVPLLVSFYSAIAAMQPRR